MKLAKAADLVVVASDMAETLSYYAFSRERWRCA
jgi:hypothetical protein